MGGAGEVQAVAGGAGKGPDAAGGASRGFDAGGRDAVVAAGGEGADTDGRLVSLILGGDSPISL